MRNQEEQNKFNPNADFRKRHQAEMHRRFIDFQFQRNELEKKLRNINDVLFSLGREMEEQFSYEELYK